MTGSTNPEEHTDETERCCACMKGEGLICPDDCCVHDSVRVEPDPTDPRTEAAAQDEAAKPPWLAEQERPEPLNHPPFGTSALDASYKEPDDNGYVWSDTENQRVEAAVAAMDGYYQDREWPSPGLAVVESLMVEVFAAADLVDPARAELVGLRAENEQLRADVIGWKRLKLAETDAAVGLRAELQTAREERDEAEIDVKAQRETITAMAQRNQLNVDDLARLRAEVAKRIEFGAQDSDITCIGCEGPTNNPDCYCDKCALGDQAEEIDRMRAELQTARADEEFIGAELSRVQAGWDAAKDEVDRLRAKAEDFEGRYETSHASRMWAEECFRRVEAELAKAKEQLRAVGAVVENENVPPQEIREGYEAGMRAIRYALGHAGEILNPVSQCTGQVDA